MSGETDYVTALVPTNQWVYSLYCVKYFGDEAHTQLLKTTYISAAYEGHLISDIEERGPWSNQPYWYTWESVAENVSHPRVIGNLYNIPMYESGYESGRREAIKRGLIHG